MAAITPLDANLDVLTTRFAQRTEGQPVSG